MEGEGVLLLPAMILLTPFLIFVNHFSYDWSDSGTLSSLAIVIGISVLCSSVMYAGGRIWHSLIVAGLLTFFIDIQFEPFRGFGLLAKYVWLGTAIGVFTISWMLKENFFRIVTVIFAVFFVVTLGQSFLSKPPMIYILKNPFLVRLTNLCLESFTWCWTDILGLKEFLRTPH